MAADSYYTIAAPTEGLYKEKGSKFLAFALPVRTADEAMKQVEALRHHYHDARHACYAYMVGAARTDFRSNDDGEPPGTAGKPILGQINSAQLSDILIVVVRYFGGILLGTGGLIRAYKTAAADALSHAQRIERIVERSITITFDYAFMSKVMSLVKAHGLTITDSQQTMHCTMTLRVRLSLCPIVTEQLHRIDGLKITEV